jgi:hypothetical protein
VTRASVIVRRIAHTFIGYLAAVIASVFVTLAPMFIAAAVEAGAASIGGAIREIGNTFVAGLMITFPFALPGFLLALVLSLLLRWRKWLTFALAGALDAIFALFLFNGFGGQAMGFLNIGMTLACVIGGIAGGVVYWQITGRFSASWRKPA